MNNQLHNWRLILNTNNYHSIFIKDTDENKAILLFYKYIDEINKIEDFYAILPTVQDIEARDYSKYVMRFAPLLKSFIENKDKKTLITEEGILNHLIKDEKRESFFKFLLKQKKNIIVFCHSDYERYVSKIQMPYFANIIDFDRFEKNLNIFNRFSEIKIAISKTYNPFKDPLVAYKNYKD